jgi:uncharacterized protein YgiM (DUF1202 family)
MKRKSVAIVALVLIAGAAFALEANQKLFVRSQGARLLKSPSPTAAAVATLKRGEEVVWVKTASDPRYQEVRTGSGKTGVIFNAQLTTVAPQGEVKGNGEVVPAVARSASGAAARGAFEVQQGAREVSKNLDGARAAAQLQVALTLACEEAERLEPQGRNCGGGR